MSRDFNLRVNRNRARYNPVANPIPFASVGGRATPTVSVNVLPNEVTYVLELVLLLATLLTLQR
jgi:hypothetical protein